MCKFLINLFNNLILIFNDIVNFLYYIYNICEDFFLFLFILFKISLIVLYSWYQAIPWDIINDFFVSLHMILVHIFADVSSCFDARCKNFYQWWSTVECIEDILDAIANKIIQFLGRSVKGLLELICTFFGYPGYMDGSKVYEIEKVEKLDNFWKFTVAYFIFWSICAPAKDYPLAGYQPFHHKMIWHRYHYTFKILSLEYKNIYKYFWYIINGLWFISAILYLDAGSFWIMCIKELINKFF